MVIKLTAAPDQCGQRLAEAVEGYLKWMRQNGYAASTICTYDRLLKHFQNFVNQRKLPGQALFTDQTLQRFEKVCPLHMASSAVRGLARHAACPVEKPRAALPDIYAHYLAFYATNRSAKRSCLGRITRLLSALDDYLTKHGIGFERLRIEHIDEFIAQYSHGYRRATRRHIRTDMRGFLKYLYYQRQMIPRDLAAWVVGAVDFARCKPPKFLRSKELQQLFGHLNTTRNKDLRTTAMVYLGYFLGLRPKEIALLRLDDIAFAKSQIRIAERKSANPLKLPLPETTLKAIAAYLVAGRPQSDRRVLFLNHRPPYRPVTAATVSYDISRVLKKINPAASAYWLRHTYAQNLFESGASIFELKEMMGHDTLQSARRYLHIHTGLMRKVLFDETL